MIPGAMDYLVEYPYGCVEQTTSRLVPIIVAYENRALLAETLQDKDVPDMVATGMKRLTELQNSDGGFSWWWASVESSDPFVTAYGGILGARRPDWKYPMV
jgi:uncharacterized protein YfaS (alpha-2-macroglobulin family)